MRNLFKVGLSMCLVTSVLTGCGSSKNKVPEVNADETKKAQVVIVGAGAAGLSAAIEAVNNGAENVIIIEKTATTGGSLNYTSGSMSGAETIIQEIDGIEDTKESFVQDILKNGANKGNEELIRLFVDENVDAIKWLWDHGLSDNKFQVDRQTGTMSVFAPEHALYSQKRTYKPSPDDGTKYKSAVHEILDIEVRKNDKIKIDFFTEAKYLVQNENGQVLTVVAEDKDGKVIRYDSEKGIIMATGGYSGNQKLMGAFTENGSHYLPGGSTNADGYGIYMMQEIGANIDKTAMSYVPTFPMGFDSGEGPGLIRPTYLWKTGGITVNKDGKRFVDETEEVIELREVALEEQPEAYSYDIFTDKIIADAVANRADMFWTYFYAPGMPLNKYVVEANSIEELAEKLGVPTENLVKTVEDYNTNVENQTKDEFGREYTQESLNNSYNIAINKIEGEKYYAVKLKALCIITLGGVQINTEGQVIDSKGNAIPGLYAAGEAVGGIWGQFVSGGTGVMGPVSFGRIAARNLMNGELAKNYTILSSQNVINKDVFVKEEKPQTESRFDMTTPIKDGEYQATVDGQEGQMTVKVVIASGKIAEVTITEQHETQSIASAALEGIPTTIVDKNSVDVDTVSGATLTSNRIMDAVAECLKQAAK